MRYNPFKYWYHRTTYYMKQPVTWFMEIAVINVFAIALSRENVLSAPQILAFILVLYVVWKVFHGFLRFIVSLFVCFAAKHHDGFEQEYYDCIRGR